MNKVMTLKSYPVFHWKNNNYDDDKNNSLNLYSTCNKCTKSCFRSQFKNLVTQSTWLFSCLIGLWPHTSSLASTTNQWGNEVSTHWCLFNTHLFFSRKPKPAWPHKGTSWFIGFSLLKSIFFPSTAQNVNNLPSSHSNYISSDLFYFHSLYYIQLSLLSYTEIVTTSLKSFMTEKDFKTSDCASSWPCWRSW